MGPQPDDATHHDASDIVRALDGPADGELELSGPGDGADPRDEQPWLDDSLPGGVDHTTAAIGAGGAGLALLGLTAMIRRRRDRRRRASLDD